MNHEDALTKSVCPNCDTAESLSPFRMDDELALITGGGSGLGLAMVQCMAAAGARVVLIGRREEPLKEAVRQIGQRADYAVHDVTKLADSPALAESIARRHGRITVLVNNAGNHVKKPALETTEEEFLTVLQTHVLGAHVLAGRLPLE